MMKRGLKYLSALFAVCLAFSCSSDEDSSGSDTLYVYSPEVPWETLGGRISMNGTPVSASHASGSLALFSCNAASFDIAFPSDAVYDNSHRTYSLTMLSSQAFTQGATDPAAFVSASSVSSSGMSFSSSTLTDIAAHVEIVIGSYKKKLSEVEISSVGGEPLSGSFTVDCRNGDVSGGSESSIRLDCRTVPSSDAAFRSDTLRFSALPATLSKGMKVSVTFTDGSKQTFTAEDSIDLESDTETFVGAFVCESETPCLLVDAPGPLDINGTTCTSIGVYGDRYLYNPQPAGSYVITSPGGCTSIPTEMQAALSPEQCPLIRRATAKGSAYIDLEPVSAILRLDFSTAEGVKRALSSLEFGSLRMTPADTLIESTDASAPTSVYVPVVPGNYGGKDLTVTSFDASFSRADRKTVTVTLPEGIVVSAGETAVVSVPNSMEFFDWIQPNGEQYSGGKSVKTSTAAVINTGFIPPFWRGAPIEYECTMEGAISAYNVDRILFGAQGSGDNKSVLFIFDSGTGKAWYHTMANVAGKQTWKQETGGAVYHIDKTLAHRRTVQIGTEGKFGTSLIYARYKDLESGNPSWTDIYADIPWFRFTSGNYRCVNPVYLFANNNSNIAGPVNEIRVRSFKITFYGKTALDMVPCMYDGIPGMYDRVEEKFHPNITGSFTLKSGAAERSTFSLGND